MGYFSELAIEILEMAEAGGSPEDIALLLNITVEDVEEVLSSFGSEYKE